MVMSQSSSWSTKIMVRVTVRLNPFLRIKESSPFRNIMFSYKMYLEGVILIEL